MGNDDIARVAAILEKNHDDLNKVKRGYFLDSFDLPGYTVVDKKPFPGEDYDKVITVEDVNGNVFIHYYGTGNGNWGYNAAAYGGPPSDMQEWALKYFDDTYNKYYRNGVSGDVNNSILALIIFNC